MLAHQHTDTRPCISQKNRAGQNHTYIRIYRVGQNCIYTPYMTVYLVFFLPKLLYTHRVYMVLANPTRIYGVHIRHLKQRNHHTYNHIR